MEEPNSDSEDGIKGMSSAAFYFGLTFKVISLSLTVFFIETP